jgi:hypothetical protein
MTSPTGSLKAWELYDIESLASMANELNDKPDETTD